MNSRRPASREAALDAVYASLPAIECRGLCHDSCGPIQMTSVERRRIEATGMDIRVAGFDPDPKHRMRCSALTMLDRCAVYEIRPAICRLWGLTRAMQCSYGCIPEGGYMSSRDGYLFLARVAEVCGEPKQAERYRRVAELDDLENKVFEIRRESHLHVDVRRSRR